MAAQMQNPNAPQNDAKALRDIWFDKLRERLTGLIQINGKLYDSYRQSWVATVAPEYVTAGREPLVAQIGDLPRIVEQLRPEERRRLEELGLIRGGRITPVALLEADLTVEKLFSVQVCERLLARPSGSTTEDGMRHAMYMATEFMYQQLQGNNAAAIYDPQTGLRFMNDLATYEIFWHFLYLAVFHGVELTADGRTTKKGDRVTPALFMRLLDERRETVQQLFAKRAIPYEETNAELVLTVLRRQVLEIAPDGSYVPQPRWIKYGSRVLLSILEEQVPDNMVILDGIFGNRADLFTDYHQTQDPAGRQRVKKALRAHDFVYDIAERSVSI
jgi:malate synthase